MNVDYLRLLHWTLPEAILAITAFLTLGIDLLVLRETEQRGRVIFHALLCSLGCAAGLSILWLFPTGPSLPGDLVSSGLLERAAKSGILVLAVFALWMPGGPRFTAHIGEHFALMLFGVIGMMWLAGSENLLMFFLALELTSLSLYVLAGFNGGDRFCAEAAFKYFLLGSIAAAFTLYGLSLVYGATGSLDLGQAAQAAAGPKPDSLLLFGVMLVVAGLGFKTAAAPFHFWAPDVYQAAPLPGTALIASASKVAGFYVLSKLLLTGSGFAGVSGAAGWRTFEPGWMPLVAVIAAISMMVGNLAAIVQRSVRRLLAYSAVAHAGYVLLAVLANSKHGVEALLYYSFTYGLTVIGAIIVCGFVQHSKGGDQVRDFSGLHRRSPFVAFCMLIFLLSLAGIPPLAGFFGKFYVFAAALRGQEGTSGLMWLVVLALAMSAVSLYYYLQVLKQVYATEENGPAWAALPQEGWWYAAIGILAGLVVLLGCVPGMVLFLLSS